MRERATKERRRLREEFVYLHREEIKQLIDTGTREEKRAFIDLHARHELNYKLTSGSFDIFCTLRRDYNRLFPAPC